MMFTCKKYRRALSQLEVVISSLLVGMVVVGALEVLGASSRTNRLAVDRLDAPGLAYQLMGEVLALPYEDPEFPGGALGPESGETGTTRTNFDDIDDYDDWSSTSPVSRDGTPVANANDYQRQVTVRYFDSSDGTTSTSVDTGIKYVEVIVTPTTGTPFQLSALRCRWGSLQQTPSAEKTMITMLDAELQIGGNSESARASIHLKNHAND